MRYLIIILLFSIISCKNDKKTTEEGNIGKKEDFKKIVDYFQIKSPITSDTFVINTQVDFKIVLKDSIKQIDSIQMFLNSKLLHSVKQTDFSAMITPEKVGRNNLSLKVFLNGGLSQRKSIDLFFLSDLKPKQIKYSLIKTYPHSIDNFTEGLVFKNGVLYESTGNFGESALFEIDLKNDKIIKSLWLSSDKFGEGITILNNKIIQLTYKSMEGYIYDINSFNRIRKFDYSFYTEGWGLTTDRTNLLMSNGTDKIFSLDSSYYSVLGEINVCDNKEAVDSLNELEYIDGLIYANIWMSNKIAQIDYQTGKVLGYIDLTAIIPVKYRNHHSNVLNGIAYNPENGHLLVTGKRWKHIYEIKLENE